MKFSIVTVVFNGVSTIKHCLASVDSQVYEAVEHIVIDGASSDGTQAVLDAHRDKLALMLSEPDGGIYDAMNKGISLARGDIIGFLNSDDFYANNQILSNVASLFSEDPRLDACYGDLIYTNQLDTSRIVRYWQSSDFTQGAFSNGWCPPHPTFFVRRSVYESFGGFDLNYRISADVELMMRLLEVHKIRVRYIPEVLVKMRMGGTTNKSLSNIWVQNQEVLRALRKNGLPANSMLFFAKKLLSRAKQFLHRPSV